MNSLVIWFDDMISDTIENDKYGYFCLIRDDIVFLFSWDDGSSSDSKRMNITDENWRHSHIFLSN